MGWHFWKAIDRYLWIAQAASWIALAHVVLVCEVFAWVLLSGKMFNLRMFGGFSLSWNSADLQWALWWPQPLRLRGFGGWFWRFVVGDFFTLLSCKIMSHKIVPVGDRFFFMTGTGSTLKGRSFAWTPRRLVSLLTIPVSGMCPLLFCDWSNRYWTSPDWCEFQARFSVRLCF